jgi:hypothetical protein
MAPAILAAMSRIKDLETPGAGRLPPTAAMMAKVTDHLWSFDEFYETVSRYNQAASAASLWRGFFVRGRVAGMILAALAMACPRRAFDNAMAKGRWLTILLAVLAAMPLLYVLSYLALVRAEFVTFKMGESFGPWPKVPEYRFGGNVARHIFHPIQRIDTQIRASYWHEDQ